MAAPPSKNPSSCSPVSRQTNPRNSEISIPIRRGFTGSPFANSPSDYSRRLHDSDDKENSKDQHLERDRVRSSGSLKGTKNFMSPTISATSKINASPRKKILNERNEAIRTSVSFSDGKSPLMENFDLKPEKGLNQRKEVSFDPIITYMEDKELLESNGDSDSLVNSSTEEDWNFSTESKTMANDCVNSSTEEDWNFSTESETMANDCVNLDPSFKISPLDADPSMAPYDPKVNYFSPRPQFLHYKPNPRIELYLKKRRDGKQLNESFASESSSDTEVTEEETMSDDSQEESEDAEEKEEEEEEPIVSEPNPINTERTVVEAKRVAKSSFFTRTKFTVLLLILVSACLWASLFNSPIMEPSVINNLSFSNPYVPPEISEYIRDSVKWLAQRFRQWVYESFSYICNMIISFKERHQPVHLKFFNLSTLLEDGLVDNYLTLDHRPFGTEIEYESNELMPTLEGGEVDIELSKQEDQPIEANENLEEVIAFNCETVQNIQEVVERACRKDTEFEDEEVIAAADNFDVSADRIVPESEEVDIPQNEVTEPGNLATEMTQERTKLSGNANVQLEDAEIQLEVSDFRQPVAQNDMNSAETIAENKKESFDSDTATKNQESESGEMTANGIKIQFSAKIMKDIPQNEVTEPGSLATEMTQERTKLSGNANVQLENAEIQLEVSDFKQPVAQNDTNSAETIAENKQESFDSDTATKNQESESVEMTANGIKIQFSAKIMMGISLFSLSILSAFAYIYVKNRTSTTPSSKITIDQVPLTKKLDFGHLSLATERTPSRNLQTDVEAVCPSEMSSFHYSKKGTGEAQSQEKKKPKKNSRGRESLASSDYSTDSPSYGSFTTYEKISCKHGNGEEVSITPVRRSSRIRSISVTHFFLILT